MILVKKMFNTCIYFFHDFILNNLVVNRNAMCEFNTFQDLALEQLAQDFLEWLFVRVRRSLHKLSQLAYDRPRLCEIKKNIRQRKKQKSLLGSVKLLTVPFYTIIEVIIQNCHTTEKKDIFVETFVNCQYVMIGTLTLRHAILEGLPKSSQRDHSL